MVFPNQECYDYHRLNRLPKQQQKQQKTQKRDNRQFKPICQTRFKCEKCKKVVWTNTGSKHKCALQPTSKDQCPECNGQHAVDQPCFIQPISLEKLKQVYRKAKREDIANIPWDPDDSDDKAHISDSNADSAPIQQSNRSKPYRFVFFDVECAQENEVQPGRFKHEPLLLCAEQICSRCIETGVKIGSNQNPLRPRGCVCRNAEQMRGGANDWVVDGSEGRQLRFHNFDNADLNPMSMFIDFLTKHGPRNITTYAISHNGIFLKCNIYYHLITAYMQEVDMICIVY